MKLVVAAAFSTALILAIGFFIVSPMFYRMQDAETEQQVMLVFSVSESDEDADWCKSLSKILETHDIGAMVFFTGEVAELNPECVTCFNDRVDIGSQTFSNSELTSIPDYSVQLDEVRRGKSAVDAAGNIYSRVFRAPNGKIDQNIYSLLSRNDILADFSYSSQYNLYLEDQFVKFDAVVYAGSVISANSILSLKKSSHPIIIHFELGHSTESIADFIIALKTEHVTFVNASQLTGLQLTIRGEQ